MFFGNEVCKLIFFLGFYIYEGSDFYIELIFDWFREEGVLGFFSDFNLFYLIVLGINLRFNNFL